MRSCGRGVQGFCIFSSWAWLRDFRERVEGYLGSPGLPHGGLDHLVGAGNALSQQTKGLLSTVMQVLS